MIFIKKLKVVSLFSGIGALESGLHRLNVDYDLVGFSEIDKPAIKTYCAIHNIDESKNLGDVTKINANDLPDFDLLMHGSPCQSFSFIGQQEGGDEGSETKSSLMWNTVDIVRSKKPKYVIWENVKAVVSPKNVHNLEKYIETLDGLGYKSFYRVVNSRDFNVAQNRERLFVVSIMDGTEYKFPEPIELTKTIRDYIDEIVADKYIVPKQVMMGYKNKKSIFKKRFRLRELDEYAYCLTAKSGRAVITNNYIYNDLEMYNNKPCENNDLDYLADNDIPVRSLTPEEYWRLQCFSPKEFSIAKEITSDAQLYKQAGNSITVDVIEGILKNLLHEWLV